MEKESIIDNNLQDLKKLYPKITPEEIKEMKKRFNSSEEYWNSNAVLLTNKNKRVIKFLLICEAPPISGNYFYAQPWGYLFNQVWKTFFTNPICHNSKFAYQCLADEGFLLIDSLPFALHFKSRDRKKPAYDALIKNCIPWWQNNLNKDFVFSNNLKIAFGFKLNSHSIIQQSGGSLILNGRSYPLNAGQIATSGSGQPTATNLMKIFG